MSVRHFCGGLIAMIFWNKGTGIVGPSQAAVFMNVMPLVGIICECCFLTNNFSSRLLAAYLSSVSI
ncbi:MAG: EamA family transporter [Phascolarctobacterium faecium]